MAIETMVPPGLEALSGAVADVAARLRDSVVGVITPGHGGGAGVIWQEDGLIVTNAHVVRGDGAEVVFADGRRLTARLVAREPGVDLAALRVEASGLPAAPLGDSDALRVGQLVLAMGHPLGESHALALGIISSVGRPLQGGGERLPNAVQADLALYPGNSGGPLADADGRVIGINSMVIPPRLALAVPSATVVRFLGPTGTGRARLGVRTLRVALPPPLVRRVGSAHEHALMVVGVLADGPAAAAGLLPGDILLAADGQALATPTALVDVLERASGGRLVLRVLRGGSVREVTVTPREPG